MTQRTIHRLLWKNKRELSSSKQGWSKKSPQKNKILCRFFEVIQKLGSIRYNVYEIVLAPCLHLSPSSKRAPGSDVSCNAKVYMNVPSSSKISRVQILWINAGLSCDGESVAITAASQPSLEDLLLGALPGLPQVILHHPLLAYENGDDFMRFFEDAAAGMSDAFILVVEGSIPNEKNKSEGYWASFGTDKNSGQPITTCEWIDRLAPKAWAVVAIGTCASYGGIHAMAGNPTGCMGLADYLGWDWKSHASIPLVCIPGCPAQPDNMTETLLYLLYMAVGIAPSITLDDQLRPAWLFGQTVHEGCDRGGYYEQGQFAEEYGGRECIVKLGCWGPVVNCNVPKRGWMAGIGGCPNVGGICIGCTMPGFPDKFMPFMSQPPGSMLSASAISTYGRSITALRKFTQGSLNKEPSWRKSRGDAGR